MTKKEKPIEIKAPDAEYIGDGVYVSYNGYHVEIAVNHHLNHVVSLEPNVVVGLKQYLERVDKFKSERHDFLAKNNSV